MSSLPESVVLNNGHKILSPEGLVDFLGVNKITKNRYVHLKFSNGKELKCSEDHPISTINGIIKAKNLDKKTEIETKDRLGCFVVSKRTIRKKIDLYDIVNSGKRHLYYSNDIVSHNCEFLGSASTLISGVILKNLAYSIPVYSEKENKNYTMDIYFQPEEGHNYVACVDCAEGVGQDYSTINIIDVTSVPYIQVAKYRSNKVPLLTFPTIIYSLATKYNEAFVLVENNTYGVQVLDSLDLDLEYENLFRVETKSNNQRITEGFGSTKAKLGVRTTSSTKKIGCANLKTLIESEKLIVHDFDTIAELTTFCKHKDSYAAQEGSTDDLVMGLVLFSWLATQPFFKEHTDSDVSKILMQQNEEFIENNMVPAGFMVDGLNDEEHEVIDGDVWFSHKGFLNSFDYGK